MRNFYDKDVEEYISHGVLYLFDFFEKLSNNTNQNVFVLNGIKNASKLHIENIKSLDLTLSLLKCEFKNVEIIDTCIVSLKITNLGPESFKEDGIAYNPKNYFDLSISSSNIKMIDITDSSL